MYIHDEETQYANNNNNNNKGGAFASNIYDKCSELQMCASDLNSLVYNSGVTVMKVKDEFEIRNTVGLRLINDKMVFGCSYCSSYRNRSNL